MKLLVVLPRKQVFPEGFPAQWLLIGNGALLSLPSVLLGQDHQFVEGQTLRALDGQTHLLGADVGLLDEREIMGQYDFLMIFLLVINGF